MIIITDVQDVINITLTDWWPEGQMKRYPSESQGEV